MFLDVPFRRKLAPHECVGTAMEFEEVVEVVEVEEQEE